MSWEVEAALICSVFLCIYLIYALLRPEKF
jgi:K+-transporting ATPase KdpF subunit